MEGIDVEALLKRVTRLEEKLELVLLALGINGDRSPEHAEMMGRALRSMALDRAEQIEVELAKKTLRDHNPLWRLYDNHRSKAWPLALAILTGTAGAIGAVISGKHG